VNELRLISRIVTHSEVTPSQLRDEFFEDACPDEWRFLKDYFKLHKLYPNRATFMEQFPDFEFEETDITGPWLLDEIEQDYIARLMRKHLVEINDLIEANPRDSLKALSTMTQSLMPWLSTSGSSVELPSSAGKRLEWARERGTRGGLTGITSGFDYFDQVTGGTQPGELEFYFARPGEGKSFVLLYSAFAAIRQKKSVAYISPEMGELEMGLRFDALSTGVSQSELMRGDFSHDPDYPNRVYEMMQEASQDWAPLHFWDAADRETRFTTGDIAQVIALQQPALVCIDGLLLIDPVKMDNDPRKRVINLMNELKTIVVSTKVPMRIAHQANRESQMSATRKHKGITFDDILPQLHHLAESGSTEQFANRAYAIKTDQGTRLIVGMRKNRSGQNGRTLTAKVDFDHAQLSDIQPVDAFAKMDGTPDSDDEELQLPTRGETPF
jgi:replicative DNA helicase